MPQATVHAMHARGWKFYQFIAGGGCRLMCAWDTTEASVDAFLADLHTELGG
jgi:threonine aldolase